MAFVILYQMANDEVGIDKTALGHDDLAIWALPEAFRGGGFSDLGEREVFALVAGQNSLESHGTRMPAEGHLVAVNFVLQPITGLDAQGSADRAGDGGLAFLGDCGMHIEFALFSCFALLLDYALLGDSRQGIPAIWASC